MVLASLVLWILWTYVPSIRVVPELIYLEWAVCGAIMALFAIFAKEPAGDPFAAAQPNPAKEAVAQTAAGRTTTEPA
jgi:hypothetical protein